MKLVLAILGGLTLGVDKPSFKALNSSRLTGLKALNSCLVNLKLLSVKWPCSK